MRTETQSMKVLLLRASLVMSAVCGASGCALVGTAPEMGLYFLALSGVWLTLGLEGEAYGVSPKSRSRQVYRNLSQNR